MINVTKLYCGGEFRGDTLRYSDGAGKAPVVVWNCTSRCNLNCRHCYSEAGPEGRPGELCTGEARELISDLSAMNVPVLLFSGGEPLLRADIFELGAHAAGMGVRPVLSTNGTLIGKKEAEALRDSGFAYAGISLDGIGEVNDRFRGVDGAFEKARSGIEECLEAGIRTGLRMTVTGQNYQCLEDILDFARGEGVSRFCIYHLVYCGRGSDMERDDLNAAQTRGVMDTILRKAGEFFRDDPSCEILTVDNHTDGVYIYLKLLEEKSERANAALSLLKRSGGNRSGEGIGCVAFDGTVFADQFMRRLPLGNVRELPFSDIWRGPDSGLLSALRDRKKRLKGRCGRCGWQEICNGNMRARAMSVYGDMWAEDPACYLTEGEIVK